eukprot:scaffold474_cov242-Pinguiococcus_pyrenoidosus.AAC.3
MEQGHAILAGIRMDEGVFCHEVAEGRVGAHELGDFLHFRVSRTAVRASKREAHAAHEVPEGCDREVGENAKERVLGIRADVGHRVVQDRIHAFDILVPRMEPQRRVSEIEVAQHVSVATTSHQKD